MWKYGRGTVKILTINGSYCLAPLPVITFLFLSYWDIGNGNSLSWPYCMCVCCIIILLTEILPLCVCVHIFSIAANKLAYWKPNFPTYEPLIVRGFLMVEEGIQILCFLSPPPHSLLLFVTWTFPYLGAGWRGLHQEYPGGQQHGASGRLRGGHRLPSRPAGGHVRPLLHAALALRGAGDPGRRLNKIGHLLASSRAVDPEPHSFFPTGSGSTFNMPIRIQEGKNPKMSGNC